MYRATTPTHTFTLPVNTNTLAEILVSYRQGNVKLDKHYENGTLPGGMSLDGARVIIKLTRGRGRNDARIYDDDNDAQGIGQFDADGLDGSHQL